MAFTSGPWRLGRVGGDLTVCDGPLVIARIVTRWTTGNPTEGQDNAKLLLAAPELFGAVQDLISVVERMPDGLPEGEVDAAIARAKAVLTAAEVGPDLPAQERRRGRCGVLHPDYNLTFCDRPVGHKGDHRESDREIEWADVVEAD